MNTYVFILCPPYSGSTILWKLVSTSSAVSSLPKEGQFLPEVRGIMRKSQNGWDPEMKIPWQEVKRVWDGYWDQDRPVLIEKSPPNLIRTGEIMEHFRPVFFLLMVRNPYAHCEGLMRRNKWGARQAVEFSIRCLRQQAENAEQLSDVLCFTYEELVSNPQEICRRVQAIIPGVGELDHTASFKSRSIDGNIERAIVDFNRKKINNLSGGDLRRINEVLRKNADVMEYWGYEFCEPSLRHTLAFMKTRSELVYSSTVARARRMKSRLIGRSAS